MNQVNIADLKTHLSDYLDAVEAGQEIIVCRRNVAIAKLSPLPKKLTRNRTQFGWCRGQIKIRGDLTAPQIPSEDWDMLQS